MQIKKKQGKSGQGFSTGADAAVRLMLFAITGFPVSFVLIFIIISSRGNSGKLLFLKV